MDRQTRWWWRGERKVDMEVVKEEKELGKPGRRKGQVKDEQVGKKYEDENSIRKNEKKNVREEEKTGDRK